MQIYEDDGLAIRSERLQAAATRTPEPRKRDGCRNMWESGATSLLGRAVLVNDHQQRGGAAAAEVLRKRLGSGPCAAQRARPEDEESATRRRLSETIITMSGGATPVLGRAVLVGDRQQRSGAAVAEVLRERQRQRQRL